MSQKNIFFKNDTIYFSETGKKGWIGCERERETRGETDISREREDEKRKKERAIH